MARHLEASLPLVPISLWPPHSTSLPIANFPLATTKMSEFRSVDVTDAVLATAIPRGCLSPPMRCQTKSWFKE